MLNNAVSLNGWSRPPDCNFFFFFHFNLLIINSSTKPVLPVLTIVHRKGVQLFYSFLFFFGGYYIVIIMSEELAMSFAVCLQCVLYIFLTTTAFIIL